MKRKMIVLLLALGWVLLVAFLISGHYFNTISGNKEASFFTPIAFKDHLQVFKGAAQCSLTSEELMERKAYLSNEIFPKVINREKQTNGFVYYFKDDSTLLGQVFEFIQKEKACCPFFKFDVSILPFEKGFAMQISGSTEAVALLEEIEKDLSK